MKTILIALAFIVVCLTAGAAKAECQMTCTNGHCQTCCCNGNICNCF